MGMPGCVITRAAEFPDNRLLNHQASFSALYVGLSPTVETGAANPKIPTRLRNMANLFSVSKYPQFALYLALILGH
jgi:hypothetical protein